MTQTKVLKIYGITMFVLAAVDIATMIVNSMGASMVGFAAIMAFVVIGVALLTAAAKCWMGYQALCYAKGTGKGTSHILIAKICLIFGIVNLVFALLGVVTGNGSFDQVIGAATNVALLFFYRKTAQECL